MGLLDRVVTLVTGQAAQSVPVTRNDGWENATTGVGTYDRDKALGSYFLRDRTLEKEELSRLYAGDYLAARVVDSVVDASFMRGFCIEEEDGQEGKGADFLKWAESKFKAISIFKQQIKLGRLFGGAGILIGERGADLTEPLIPERCKGVDWILPLDRRQLYPLSWCTKLGPDFSTPETYAVSLMGSFTSSGQAIDGKGRAVQTAKIHASRLIRFDGELTDRVQSMELQGWSFSVLQRCYPILRSFASGMGGIDVMLTDASQGVIKIKNLISLLAGANATGILKRLQALDMGRSVARSILLDADSETYENVDRNFTGVADILDRKMYQLSSATGIPVSILFGRSAAGMNATGELDLSSWYDQVEAYREERLEPKLNQFLTLLATGSDSPLRGSIDVEFPKLKATTTKDDADVYSTVANADKTYVDMGAVDPAQIAIARFGSGKFSPLTSPKVDVAALEKELTQRAEFEPPAQPPPLPPGAPDAPPVQALPTPENAPQSGSGQADDTEEESSDV